MESSPTKRDDEAKPRRTFLAAAISVFVGSLACLTPIAAGLAFFFDPLLKKRAHFKGGDVDGFLPVAKLIELPEDGTPLRFVLRADKIDAWNIFKNQTIGTVYLRKMPGGQVIAFNDTCPHLGCKVEYHDTRKSFLCPCHASAFKIDGKPMNKIPPRALDDLQVKTDADGQIWVKYQDFQCGNPRKETV